MSIKSIQNFLRSLEDNIILLFAIILYWFLLPIIQEKYSTIFSITFMVIVTITFSLLLYFFTRKISFEKRISYVTFYILLLIFILECIYLTIFLIDKDPNLSLPNEIINPTTFYWTLSSLFQGFSALLGLLTAILITFVSKLDGYNFEALSHKMFVKVVLQRIKTFYPSLILIGVVILLSVIFLPFSELVNHNSILFLSFLFFIILLSILSIISLLLSIWKYFKDFVIE